MFIGFVMFVVGLVGRRKTVITNVVQVSNIPGQGMQANIPLDFDDQQPRGSRRIEPPYLSSSRGEGVMLAAPPVIDVTPRDNHSVGYDKAKWNALVQYDPDISRIVEALAPYDRKYVEEFATAYLALNDKSYLPMIVQKILTTAKQDMAAANRQRY